jgi:PAS domain-containing protein
MGHQLLERVRDAVAQRQPVAIDLYHSSAKRWVAAYIQPEPETVTVTLRDRTHRKQCASLLHLLNATVLEGLWRTLPDGTIQTANAAFARFLGVEDPDTLEGENVEQFIATAPNNPGWSALHDAVVE